MSLARTLEALERQHLDAAVRSDPQRLGQLLHADFLEHGQSGRVWRRDEVIARLAAAPPSTDGSTRTLDRYQVIEAADTRALTRWRALTRNADGGIEAASWRSSWWVHERDAWQLRFHTGTRVADLLLALDDTLLADSQAGFGTLHRCTPPDFDSAVDLRIAAMRESLEALGRFDPQRARARLQASWLPERSWKLIHGGEWLGFCTIRARLDAWSLDHFYIHPKSQRQGIGSAWLQRITALADALEVPIALTALRGSAANRFYARMGFASARESEWDILRERPVGHPG